MKKIIIIRDSKSQAKWGKKNDQKTKTLAMKNARKHKKISRAY